MTDWKKIEAEYITTDTSYRRLAKKYGLNQATIAQKAKAEDWVGKRERQASTTQALILEDHIANEVDRAKRLYSAADQLLQKIVAGIEATDAVTPSAAKNYADALKNIKDIHSVRTKEDIEEQRARIEKLKKDAEKQDTDKQPITIVLEGSLSEYAQ